MGGWMGDWSEERMKGMLDLFYRSLLEEHAWQEALDALSSTFPGGKGIMFMHDMTVRRGAFALTSQIDHSQVASYNRYYNAINPWMKGAASRRIGVAVRAERMLAFEELEKTECYADWLKPQDMITGVGLTIFRQNGRSFILSVCGANPDHTSWDVGVGAMTGLGSHLARIAELHRHAAMRSPLEQPAQDLLEAAAVAIFAIGENRLLSWTNGPAKSALEIGDMVRVRADRKVVLTEDEPNTTLARMLDGPSAANGVPRIARFLVTSADGFPYHLTLVNVTRSSLEYFLKGPSVFAVLRRSTPNRHDLSVAIRRRFKLTPRETTIATALGEGRSPEDIAESLDISRQTVRVHMRTLFDKMDVSRQSEVAATLLSLALLPEAA